MGSSGSSAKCSRIRLRSNLSIPAGTGVCVVNTVPARQTWRASSKLSPCSAYSRIRSRPRNPACPSLVWNTSGERVPAQRAERPDRAHPAHAEQQFLAEPVVAAAAVQPVGDLVQVGLVLLHVGVEQQQRDPADLGHPDLRGQLPAHGQAHGDVHRRAGVVAEQFQRQPVRVVGRVPLGLPAVGGQRLGEVTVPVQQADGDQRHAEVARRLQVVARQDAQAARILRQRGGDAVFGGEVRHRGGAWRIRGPGRPRPRTSAAPTCTAAGPARSRRAGG